MLKIRYWFRHSQGHCGPKPEAANSTQVSEVFRPSFVLAAFGLAACVVSAPESRDDLAIGQAAEETFRVRCEAVVEPCLIEARETCPGGYLIDEIDRRTDGTGTRTFNTRMTIACDQGAQVASSETVFGIHCSEAPSFDRQDCYAVVERGEPGYATMTLSRQDGFTRTLVFSPDDVHAFGGASVSWSRDADSWFIGVQGGTERYFITDADIYGRQHPAFST